MKYLKNIFLLLFFLGFTPLLAQEVISNYDVLIKVRNDRSLWVEENITVEVEGKEITNGILRDIINVMQDSSGNYYRYNTKIREVLRNGNTEKYELSNHSDFLRIKIGDIENPLTFNSHTYTITYTMAGQVRFFPDHDEIYWNAIGTYWTFPVLKGSVNVELPDEAQIKNLYAFSGPLGSEECDCTYSPISSNHAFFELNKGLNKQEGFAVSVSFDKGVIAPPSASELRSDRSLMMRGRKYALWVMYGSAFLILTFYYLVWRKVGKDPKKGQIVPRWDIPGKLSPAATRYIYGMGFDRDILPTCLISAAIKGHLEIEQEKDFTLTRIHGDEKGVLSADEQLVLNELFTKNEVVLKVDDTNYSLFDSASQALQIHLKKIHKRPNFTQNYIWLLPGIIVSLTAYIFSMIYLRESNVISLLSNSMISLLLIYASFKSRKNTRLYAAFFALLFAGFATVFIVKEGVLDSSLVFIPGASVLFLCNFIFYYLLPAPTKAGRKLMDHIAGLKIYLGTAEKDRLNILNPPDENLQLFESMFPYALALGVEQKWSKRFRDQLDKEEYDPTWYRSMASSGFSSVASSLGSSFSSSVSSANSSSSGSSGSSGGGGGGGGGSGW